MDEAATNNLTESEPVSDFEFILPWKVIETCCSLKTNGSSCFVSVNPQNNTENRLYVSKLEDNSIKIKIAISTLSMVTAEEEGKVVGDEGELADVVNGENDEKEDEQLDRMLLKDESGIVNLDHHNVTNNSCLNEGLSTVIIVKKIECELDSTLNTTNGDDDSKSDLAASVKMDELSEKSMGSSKTKSENGKLNFINLLSNPEDESDILCELCFKSCENYQQLVRHVKKHHRDCTFVRNYLDDIKTLTFSHCPHCRKEFVAKSSLDAHIKVTHGGQISNSKLSPLIQKYNINKQELTYSRLFNKQYFTNKINEPTNNTTLSNNNIKVSLERHEKPVLDQSDDDDSSVELNGKQKIKCDICNEGFDTRQEAIQHQNKVHRPSLSNNSNSGSNSYKCTYCCKVYESKEKLLKHCLKTHFRSIEDMSVGRKRKGGGDGDDDDEDDYSGNEILDSDDDNDSEFDDVGGGLEDNVKVTRSKKGKAQKKKINNANITKANLSKKKKKKHPPNKKINNTTSSKSTSGSSSRSVSPSFSSNSGKASKGEFCCNLCGADFNRMTLLVTHARYCRKKCL